MARLCLHSFLLLARATTNTMAFLGRPRCYQSQDDLNLVRIQLGCTTLDCASGVRVGSLTLGGLQPREFIIFVSYISAGLMLLIPPSLLAAVGRLWASSSTPYTTFHPRGGNLRPSM